MAVVWAFKLCVKFASVNGSRWFISGLLTAFFHPVCATAGQEDPFELDSNLSLSSGRHGEDRKRQYPSGTTMKHRYLTIWLTYCNFMVLHLFFLCSVFFIQ